MLRSKLLLTLCVVTVMLALVAEQEVAALPEPCHGHDKAPMKKPPAKKPETKKPPKKEKKMKELEKLFKKFYPDWEVHIEETTTTTEVPPEEDIYTTFVGKLLEYFFKV